MHPKNVVVVGLDDTSLAPLVLDTVLEQARAPAAAAVHLVHVVDDALPATFAPRMGPNELELREAEAERMLGAAARYLGERLAVETVVHAPLGSPRRELVRVAENESARLVVVGTHGRTGVARALLGSVAEYVVRHASCPVLVVRENRTEAEPAVEPPCPDCVATRRATGDVSAWCARHAEHHVHGRLHYAWSQGYGRGSSFLRGD